jgi:hypothetical protein
MERVRVVCFQIRSSEASNPRLCRFRIASVGPCGTSIDYVLTHIGVMGSHKLSVFDGL